MIVVIGPGSIESFFFLQIWQALRASVSDTHLTWVQVAGLILENTFTSVLDMAGVMLPGLRFVVGGKGRLLNWFVKSPWKTIELIKQVHNSARPIFTYLDAVHCPSLKSLWSSNFRGHCILEVKSLRP